MCPTVVAVLGGIILRMQIGTWSMQNNAGVFEMVLVLFCLQL